MGDGWIPQAFRFSTFLALIVVSGIEVCFSLNDEGLALLAFRAQVTSDPYAAFDDWNPNENDPCRWTRVHCVSGEVHKLLLCDNEFEGSVPLELQNLSSLYELQFDDDLVFLWDAEIGSVYRNFGHWIWQRNPIYMKSSDASASEDSAFVRHFSSLPNPLLKHGKDSQPDHTESNDDYLPSSVLEEVDDSAQNIVNTHRRKLLDESSNLAAAPVSSSLPSSDSINTVTSSRSSGTFPAVPKKHKQGTTPIPAPLPHPHLRNTSSNFSDPLTTEQNQTDNSRNFWKYVIIIGGVSLSVWAWMRRSFN